MVQEGPKRESFWSAENPSISSVICSEYARSRRCRPSDLLATWWSRPVNIPAWRLIPWSNLRRTATRIRRAYAAATALLDRGYGRPAQSLDLHLSADAITKRLSDMTDAELAALEARMIAAAPIVLEATAEAPDDAGELPDDDARIPRRMPLPEAAALLRFVRGLTRCLTARQYSTRHGPSPEREPSLAHSYRMPPSPQSPPARETRCGCLPSLRRWRRNVA